MQWSDLISRLRRLADKQNSDTAAMESKLSDMQAQLDQFKAQIANIEQTVDEFVSGFESKLQELARRGTGAKDKADRDLRALRKDLDAYIDVVETLVRGQMDAARRQEISRLLTSARRKRTRISNEIERRAANDG